MTYAQFVLQAQSKSKPSDKSNKEPCASMMDVWHRTIKEKGLLALYDGSGSFVTAEALKAGFKFMLKDVFASTAASLVGGALAWRVGRRSSQLPLLSASKKKCR